MGSNSFRLAIYRFEKNKLSIMLRQKEAIGLARYVKDGDLSSNGTRKATKALGDFLRIARRFVDEENIHVFATASLRGVNNRAKVLKILKAETGIKPLILAGEEEALLGFAGASHSLPPESKRGIYLDIGGASTEILEFKRDKQINAISLPIGSLNLFMNNVSHLPPNKEELRKLKIEIGKQFDSFTWEKKKTPLMLGVGGTARASAKLMRKYFDLPKECELLETAHLDELVKLLASGDKKLFQIVVQWLPERTLTILPGMLILNEAVKRFEVQSLLVSSYGLREGYLLERVIRRPDVVLDSN